MPEQFSEADVARILELRRQGLLDSQIAAELNKPPAPLFVPGESDPGLNPEQRAGAAADDRLHAEGIPSSREPAVDPVADAIRAGHDAGGRGTSAGVEATIDALFKAAERGDPAVMHKGTMDPTANERWMADAKRRQLANRGAQQRGV